MRTDISPKLHPVTRLKDQIDHRSEPVPEFSLKPLTRQNFKKTQAAGVDTVDSFSLNIVAP